MNTRKCHSERSGESYFIRFFAYDDKAHLLRGVVIQYNS